VRKAQLDQLVTKVHKEPKEQQDQQVTKEHRVLKERKVL
jgi:hypothetical protein